MLDNNNSKFMIVFFLIMTIVMAGCPDPSELDDRATVTVNVDLSKMINLDDVKLIRVALRELVETAPGQYDWLEDYRYQDFTTWNGSSLSCTFSGVEKGTKHAVGVVFADSLDFEETIGLGDVYGDVFQVSENGEYTESFVVYSDRDGRYTESDAASLRGTIDLSALDLDLVDICEICLRGDDKDDSTDDDPYLYAYWRLDGTDSLEYSFANLDPACEWEIYVEICDWNHSVLGMDGNSFSYNYENFTISADTVKDLTVYHTFDTRSSYDGSNGHAEIRGTLDVSHLSSEIYQINIECKTDYPNRYSLEYEFANIDLDDVMTYRFTSLDPTKDHTLSFRISARSEEFEYEWDSEPTLTISAADLVDGQVTSGDFILPAP